MWPITPEKKAAIAVIGPRRPVEARRMGLTLAISPFMQDEAEKHRTIVVVSAVGVIAPAPAK
jgi:hypothetical protein